MALSLESLNEQTRSHMLAELEQDIHTGVLYMSPRLSDAGARAYPALLREAIESHNDEWLAQQLRDQGLLRSHEERRKPKGGTTLAKVPTTAADTLGEGEFNRFYCRGVCAYAATQGRLEVEVYRGRASANPRPESEALVGTKMNAAKVLIDLRTSQGVEPALGVPPGPNSGLTIRL
jgi:hypothetical protein